MAWVSWSPVAISMKPVTAKVDNPRGLLGELTAPLRSALVPIDVIADRADNFLRSWPTPLRQTVLPLGERG